MEGIVVAKVYKFTRGDGFLILLVKYLNKTK